jgi:hypothetical protein
VSRRAPSEPWKKSAGNFQALEGRCPTASNPWKRKLLEHRAAVRLAEKAQVKFRAPLAMPSVVPAFFRRVALPGNFVQLLCQGAVPTPSPKQPQNIGVV